MLSGAVLTQHQLSLLDLVDTKDLFENHQRHHYTFPGYASFDGLKEEINDVIKNSLQGNKIDRSVVLLHEWLARAEVQNIEPLPLIASTFEDVWLPFF
jgi:hypothetical protein